MHQLGDGAVTPSISQMPPMWVLTDLTLRLSSALPPIQPSRSLLCSRFPTAYHSRASGPAI